MELGKDGERGGARLGDEARDMRLAGRKLADDADGTDVVGALKALEEAIHEQRRSNEEIARRMDRMLYQMRGIIDEVASIQADARDESHAAEQAALNGVNAAQKKAEDITLANINEVTERSKRYIDTMVQESRRRIERLAMVTLPDRLFQFGKWVALTLVIFILAHVVWGMMT